MTMSSNSKIQKLMKEVEALDSNDRSLETKLHLIAQKVAEEQQKAKAKLTGMKVDDSNLIDPSDAFACEGCQ